MIVTRKALVSQLIYGTYKPLLSYPSIASTIRALETEDQMALTAFASQIVKPIECKCNTALDPRMTSDNEATYSIACGESDEKSWDEDAFS